MLGKKDVLSKKQARCHYLLLKRSKTDWLGEAGAGEVSAMLGHFAHGVFYFFLTMLAVSDWGSGRSMWAFDRGGHCVMKRHFALAGLPHLGSLKRIGMYAVLSYRYLCCEVLGRMLPVAARGGSRSRAREFVKGLAS
jgi:hypothetical protein